LFSCPNRVLTAAAKWFGKSTLEEKLLETLPVDISKAKQLLSLLSPVSVQDGLDCFFRKE